MTDVKRYILICLGLLIFVVGCGAANTVTVPTASIPTGGTHRLEISDCPAGSVTTLFITNHGVGPNGASISGLSQTGVLPHNGRVQVNTPCGNFDLGRYVANQDTGTVDLYLGAPRKL